jgi:hypothetical protein
MVSQKPFIPTDISRTTNLSFGLVDRIKNDLVLKEYKDRHSAESERIKQFIQNLTVDLRDLENYYNIPFSSKRILRLGEFFTEQAAGLVTGFDFDKFDQNGKVDWLLTRAYVVRQQQGLRTEWSRIKDLSPLMGWADGLISLCEQRQAARPVDWKDAAQLLSDAKKKIAILQADIQSDKLKESVTRFIAYRAVQAIQELQRRMEEWHGFYSSYDPMFDWWVKKEWESLPANMQELVVTMRVELIGIGPDQDDAIVGLPSGRESILDDLKSEIIPYTPEEIIKIGETEYDWCEKEMIKASRDLGYGTDWKAALEHVKNMYVEPGRQIHMVHELAEEAVQYVTANDMVTVPQVARETWRTFMMPPDKQKTNPFFLGGDSIIVSYPTSTMPHEDRLMIMRGNNGPFSRSTVFHELIPGHHLQFYYMDRKSVPDSL